jgi:RNA polymerase sigma-70 factor, ECF subfamily
MRDCAGAISGIERLKRLLLACGHKDEAAFGELYVLTKRNLFGVALKILRRSDLAEEVLQEAYIRIWRKADHYDPALGSPITWMTAIVRNLAIDAVRRPANEGNTDDDSILVELPASQENALEAIEASEKRGRAFAALVALDPLQRTLIVAAYVKGESREQLAIRFDRPVGTIKTWLRRALLKAELSMASAMAEY